MKSPISKPANKIQRQFNDLCELGGGLGGGPARGKVQELLHRGGEVLNAHAYDEISTQLHEFPDRNPWHVCFAVGLSWGHLAQLNSDFTKAATNLMLDWNDDDLKIARSFHSERGPEPIEHSLRGAFTLFQKVLLPDSLPNTLEQFGRAQERWLTPILSNDRPKYIGSWNSTAMFMVGLFANPELAATLSTPKIMLPPGGPIFNALITLHKARILAKPPSGSELDDAAFEPGAIYENNALFADIHKGHKGWGLLEVHSGLYLLGTNLPISDQWC